MTTIAYSTRNVPLITARIIAGLLGTMQLGGVVFFLLISPEESIWLGPWIDVPVVAVTLSVIALKLGLAALPALPATRRITMGLVAVAIGGALTIFKIFAYDEPEAVFFLAFDAVLLVTLALASRTASR